MQKVISYVKLSVLWTLLYIKELLKPYRKSIRKLRDPIIDIHEKRKVLQKPDVGEGLLDSVESVVTPLLKKQRTWLLYLLLEILDYKLLQRMNKSIFKYPCLLFLLLFVYPLIVTVRLHLVYNEILFILFFLFPPKLFELVEHLGSLSNIEFYT